MENLYKTVNYDELLNDYCSFYIKQFGQIEFEKIALKIQSSSKIKSFLLETEKAKIKPLRDDFLVVIHSIFYFTFSSPEKISTAAIILLSRWNKFVAVMHHLSDNIHLNQTFFDILDKSDSFKFHISNKEIFFEKFKIQTKIKFEKINNRFNPPNIFSEIVYEAVVAHIIVQKKNPNIGVFNCYIFYSTYISLLTSYLNLNNSDNVDLYLAEGMKAFFEFLKIEVDQDYYSYYNFDCTINSQFLGGYVEHFSNYFTMEIDKFNRDLDIYFNFFLLFTVNEITEIDELEPIENTNFNEIIKIIKTNFTILNAKYDLILPLSKSLLLEKWAENQSFELIYDETFIKRLIIYPFQRSRCQICGDITFREELKISPYSSDGNFPMCIKCRIKNES